MEDRLTACVSLEKVRAGVYTRNPSRATSWQPRASSTPCGTGCSLEAQRWWRGSAGSRGVGLPNRRRQLAHLVCKRHSHGGQDAHNQRWCGACDQQLPCGDATCCCCRPCACIRLHGAGELCRLAAAAAAAAGYCALRRASCRFSEVRRSLLSLNWLPGGVGSASCWSGFRRRGLRGCLPCLPAKHGMHTAMRSEWAREGAVHGACGALSRASLSAGAPIACPHRCALHRPPQARRSVAGARVGSSARASRPPRPLLLGGGPGRLAAAQVRAATVRQSTAV